MFLSHIMLGFVFYFDPFFEFISMSFSALLADMSGFAGYCLTPSLLLWFLLLCVIREYDRFLCRKGAIFFPIDATCTISLWAILRESQYGHTLKAKNIIRQLSTKSPANY